MSDRNNANHGNETMTSENKTEPRWVAVVKKDDTSGLYYYDLTDNGNGTGTCGGFRTIGAATYAAGRMTEKMNAANFYK